MVHDDRTYLDDEGLEYVTLGGGEEELQSTGRPQVGPAGPLWGADESYGGYDAE
jgi:hypothetical protein